MIEIAGVFRGATLDSWRFDFRHGDGSEISGRLAETLTEDDVLAMLKRANEHCVGIFKETVVVTRSGAQRVSYESLELK